MRSPSSVGCSSKSNASLSPLVLRGQLLREPKECVQFLSAEQFAVRDDSGDDSGDTPFGRRMTQWLEGSQVDIQKSLEGDGMSAGAYTATRTNPFARNSLRVPCHEAVGHLGATMPFSVSIGRHFQSDFFSGAA